MHYASVRVRERLRDAGSHFDRHLLRLVYMFNFSLDVWFVICEFGLYLLQLISKATENERGDARERTIGQGVNERERERSDSGGEGDGDGGGLGFLGFKGFGALVVGGRQGKGDVNRLVTG